VRDPEFIAERLEVIKLGRRCAPAAACELLAQMLQQDVAMRITAMQALAHPNLYPNPKPNPSPNSNPDPKP